MKKNFDFFIDCLKQLPEQNTAGMPLKVYMPNVLRIESGELVPVRSHIDGAKYASFIDEAVVSTMQEVGERRGVAAEKVMEELKGINGKHMVERASVEFMSFVEDVYILLRKD